MLSVGQVGAVFELDAVLDRLDEEQLVALRDKCLRELLDSAGAVDRDLAESTVRRLYEFAGLPAPQLFLWCELPEDGLIAATLVARSRLPQPVPLKWHDALDGILLGRRIREEIINPDATLSDEAMRELGRLLPSLADTCRVFRDRLGARGVLALTDRTPFAIETWMDGFSCVEEQFEWQAPAFMPRWRKAAEAMAEMAAEDPRAALRQLSGLGNWILQASTSFWDWSHPPMFSGGLEVVYAAIAEMHAVSSAEPGAQAIENEGLALLVEYIRHCGWCFPFADLCIMCERPDALFQAKEIESEPNIEVRRLMIDLYGVGRYLAETKARLVHTDECGELYKRLQLDDEDLVVVKVINSTAEPDGTFKEYFLRVPPQMKTAREAVAWSFGLSEAEYKPDIET
jgi:hypothetical protein